MKPNFDFDKATVPGVGEVGIAHEVRAVFSAGKRLHRLGSVVRLEQT